MCKINHFDYITREMELSIRKIQKGGKNPSVDYNDTFMILESKP